MAGTRQNNTMQEGLMQLLSAISQLKPLQMRTFSTWRRSNHRFSKSYALQCAKRRRNSPKPEVLCLPARGHHPEVHPDLHPEVHPVQGRLVRLSVRAAVATNFVASSHRRV